MLKKALIVAGLLAIICIAIGANFTGTAKPISQIPIIQAIRMGIGEVGNLSRKHSIKPYTATLPKHAGFALTQIYSRDVHSSYNIGVQVNGLVVYRLPMGISSSLSGLETMVSLDPPILVPPGATLEIGTIHSNNLMKSTCGIGGYYLTRSDMGL